MLHTFDLVIVFAYLVIMVAVGILSRGKQESAADYFTAGHGFTRLLGSVLIGLSIAAAYFSGISFLVYPSVVFSNGLAIVCGIGLLPLCWVIVGYWFLPRYLRHAGSQPYEIIEKRFGYPARAVAAGMFVLLRVAWMGTLIYAPTVAVMTALRLPATSFWPLVLLIGFSCTLYSTLGGIRGVIITDAIQMLVIMVGVLLPIGYVYSHLPVSSAQAWKYLGDNGRLKWLNTSFSFHEPFTIWSIIAGMLVGNLGTYLGDQMSLQRYLASESIPAARRAFAVNIVGVVIVVLLLATIGLAMAAWYGLVPGAVAPKKADEVFPFFVVTELPAGAPGLIIASILAATMSTMTSGINALSGTITLDFASRTGRLKAAGAQLRFARITSLVVGLAATMVAGLVSHLGSIFEIISSLSGVFCGPLLACMVLSVANIRVSGRSMMTGMIAGTIAGWVVIASHIYILWVAPSAALVSFAIPLLSMVLTGPNAYVIAQETNVS